MEALRILRQEFPNGEAQYRAWFLWTIGIHGDPIAAREAIRIAVAAGGETDGNAYGYSRAFSFTPDQGTIDRIRLLSRLRARIESEPVVVDPFAGGGAIPFEASRFGCKTIANELNPVATAILYGTVVLPAQLGPEFAEVIELWGNRWVERVRARLAPFFPHVGPNERLAYVWAHTVPCPTTGLPTPLAPDYWLARGKAGRDVALRLSLDDRSGDIRTEVVDGNAAAQWGNRGTYRDGVATSVWTGHTFGGDYIRQAAVSGRMGELMLAVSVTVPGRPGRRFRAPSDDDLAAVKAAYMEADRLFPRWEVEGLVPVEPIDTASNYDRGHRMYGINRWADFFTRRQLLSHVTALEELRVVMAQARRELPADSFRALALYMAFALDKAVDYSSRQSSWDATRLKIRNTFDKHNFAFKWAFAELDGAAASLPWGVDQVANAYRGIARLALRPPTLLEPDRRAQSRVTLGSAASLPLPDHSVDAIVTDPPYYDNVMYAECSDYFYVWLKRSLADTWPDLCQLVLTDKEAEAVANPSIFRDVATARIRGRKKETGHKTANELADDRYESLLTTCFKESHRVLKDDGVLTVMFTHKRVDAWDTLGQALLEAGFSINSSWPVHTESEHSLHQAKKNSASSTVFLTCRKRGTTQPAYWSDLKGEVSAAARQAASRFSADGMTGIDLTLSTFGPVLSVLSRNWPVYTGELNEAGNPGILRPDVALDLAREEVARLKKRNLLGGRDVDFDRITDWYLLAWDDFQAAEFPSGEALKLSLATHLDLDELAKQYKVLRSASGSVTLLTPAQRRTAGAIDPERGPWPTMLDALHSIMLVYDEDGLTAARNWLRRTGREDDQRFAELVSAAIRAIPRTRENGEFVRPEARTLEGLRATLFGQIPPPADREVAPAQAEMALEV
jgi:adenine-specific DNA methylase